MELTIQGRSYELDDSTRDYVSDKINRVSHHISGARVANVLLGQQASHRQDQRFSAQIAFDVNGSVLRSEERATTARAAFAAAAHAIDKRVSRLKGWYRSEKGKHSHELIRFDEPEAEAETFEEDGMVVRVKRFSSKPMPVEEAIFQMDMLGHDFFFFQSSEDQQYNLLYKRTDGDYGLIVPDAL